MSANHSSGRLRGVGGTSLSGLPDVVVLHLQALSVSGGWESLLTVSEACHAPTTLPTKELSSVSASAGHRRICPLLSAELDFSPSVLGSRSFHHWLFNGYLTKVNLLNHINLLLALVVVMVRMVMVGATMPFRTTVVMTVMTVFMMIVMIVMVRPFFLCWCIHIC
ncbi:unnamed protein product [Leuciscus chuanchicus]